MKKKILFTLAFIIFLFLYLYFVGNYRYIKILNCTRDNVNLELKFRDNILLNENIEKNFISTKFVKIKNNGGYFYKLNDKSPQAFSYDMAGIGYELKLKTFYIIITPKKEIFMYEF
ncbi:MAG: hypothetical protein R3Y46_02640 [Opitutales bacterium]